MKDERDSALHGMKAAATKGNTILLGSGRYFDYLAPEATPPTIEDVAWGLAFTCRFRGQTVHRKTGRRIFYSVAEHCVRMSWLIPEDAAYDALMHELGEVAVGDTPTPLKRLCPDIRAVEGDCETAAFKQFGVEMRDHALVKLYDLRMLATEKRDLMNHAGEEWADLGGARPFDFEIVPWDSDKAAGEFLKRYAELRGDGA